MRGSSTGQVLDALACDFGAFSLGRDHAELACSAGGEIQNFRARSSSSVRFFPSVNGGQHPRAICLVLFGNPCQVRADVISGTHLKLGCTEGDLSRVNQQYFQPAA
jgi:hypothetical protein